MVAVLNSFIVFIFCRMLCKYIDNSEVDFVVAKTFNAEIIYLCPEDVMKTGINY